MRRQRILMGSLVLAVLLLSLLVGLGAAQGPQPPQPLAPEAALGSAFTYQGQLEAAGGPVNGDCDMAFRLYDAAAAGSQVGGAISTTVPITDGLFAVTLNGDGEFGATAFNGEARWLGVRVQCPTDVSFTDLGRQELTATPYALYALEAPWSGLRGIPAGFADGSDDGAQYQNVVVVAKSGGDFSSIQAALDSITGTADNRYLVWVAPGTYTETVTMEEYVDIEGAGELATKITYPGSTSQFAGTVLGTDNAELRFLSVENTGGNNFAVAIYNDSSSPRLTHVTANASGGSSDNIGVYNYSSSPTMTDVSVSVSGGGDPRGVYNESSSSPTMTDVSVSVSGGSGEIYGVHNSSSSPMMIDVTVSVSSTGTIYAVANTDGSSTTMLNVIASATGGAENNGLLNKSSSATILMSVFSASGGHFNYGVFNWQGSTLTMTNVIASASGGTTDNHGVYNYEASATITAVTARASGGYASHGIFNTASSGSYTVTVNNSLITGGNGTIRGDSEFTVLVGASMLSGGTVDYNGGSITCAGVYSETYEWSDDTCP